MELIASENSALLFLFDATGVDPNPLEASAVGEKAGLLDLGIALTVLLLALSETLEAHLVIAPHRRDRIAYLGTWLSKNSSKWSDCVLRRRNGCVKEVWPIEAMEMGKFQEFTAGSRKWNVESF